MLTLPNWLDAGFRYILSLIFIVFGLNGLVTFIPVPEFHPFMELLVESGYLYLVKVLEIIGGVLLLFPRTVPLALVILTPIVVNICAYHAFFDSRNWPITIVLGVLTLALLAHRSERFRLLLRADEANKS